MVRATDYTYLLPCSIAMDSDKNVIAEVSGQWNEPHETVINKWTCDQAGIKQG